MKLTDISPTGRFFGMLVAEPRVGKTCAAISFPTPGLLLDIDMNVRGALVSEHWLGRDHLNGWDIETCAPDKGFTGLEKILEKVKFELDLKACKYKTIVLDSVSTLARMLITDALKISDRDPRTNKEVPVIKSNIIGTLHLPGPGHFRYEQEAIAQIISYLKGFPINVVFTGHIIDKYGKPPGTDNPYVENVVVGEKLSLRDKVNVNVLQNFTEIYKFKKVMSAGKLHHSVYFQDGDIACTVHRYKLPTTPIDITEKSFYETWTNLLKTP